MHSPSLHMDEHITYYGRRTLEADVAYRKWESPSNSTVGRSLGVHPCKSNVAYPELDPESREGSLRQWYYDEVSPIKDDKNMMKIKRCNTTEVKRMIKECSIPCHDRQKSSQQW